MSIQELELTCDAVDTDRLVIWTDGDETGLWVDVRQSGSTSFRIYLKPDKARTLARHILKRLHEIGEL